MPVTARDIYNAVHRPEETWGKIFWHGDEVVIIVWGTGDGDSFTFPQGAGVIWDDEYLFHTHPRGASYLPSQIDLSNKFVPGGYMFIFGETGAVKFSPDGRMEEYPPDHRFGENLIVYWPDTHDTVGNSTEQAPDRHNIIRTFHRFFAGIVNRVKGISAHSKREGG